MGGPLIIRVFLYTTVVLALDSASALAAQPSLKLGVTSVGQAATDGGVGAELEGSLDILVAQAIGPGAWALYVEGNTTPKSGGISAMLPEVNGDAGTALDADGDGRFQVSELRYTLRVGAGELVFGLLDVTGYLDISRVANDETSQFLGTTFVNNPVIEFPDYTLGGVYLHRVGGEGVGPRGRRRGESVREGFGFVMALTSSNGLSDNDRASYAELFDVGGGSRGMFGALEAFWQSKDVALGGGVWVNTRDHLHVENPFLDRESNYGLYGVADISPGLGTVNLRAGLSNGDVSRADSSPLPLMRCRSARYRLVSVSDGSAHPIPLRTPIRSLMILFMRKSIFSSSCSGDSISVRMSRELQTVPMTCQGPLMITCSSPEFE